MTNVLPIVVDFSWLDSRHDLASIHMIIIPSGEFVKVSLKEMLNINIFCNNLTRALEIYNSADGQRTIDKVRSNM